MKQNDRMIGSLSALGCELLFGLSYLFTKKVTQTAGVFALLGWRFFIAAVLMSLGIGVGLIRINLKGKPIKPLLLVAFFSPFLYFVGETMGIRDTTASESGVFLACIPVASLVASALLLKKKPSNWQIAGVLVTLLGVLITVFAVGAASSRSFAGYAFLLMAVMSYAQYSVFVEKAADYTGTEITYIMLVVGAVVFGGLAICEAMATGTIGQLAMLPLNDSAFAAAVLYQGIGCSIAAFFLSNVAISRIGVNRTSSFIGVATVVSVIAGAILLKETFTVYQGIGATVILIGVYTANVTRT
ncbi:MAG: DMT family transporter [Christensenella sp.]|nr:DMT family transporter [Christensenella sp.]